MAITTLCELQKSRIPVDNVFTSILTRHPLNDQDRQLAANIIFGSLRNRESLDIMLQYLCRQQLKKFNPFVLQALRVGLFQLMYLDRIPESAAVNESVKAVQAARLPKRLHGFVNGVLRNAIRKREELLALTKNSARPVLNHPEWLTKRWEKQYGKPETVRICRQNNEQAALSLQINASITDRNSFSEMLSKNDINSHPGRYCEDTLILDGFTGAVHEIPGFTEGHFQVQDQGAQLLAKLIGPMTEKAEYLDACAGVGGKTSILLQMAKALQANISAVEPDTGRRGKFFQNMKRLHPDLNIPLFSGTLQEFATSTSKGFHGILLDAPCSGTGVIRRHPDIRWNRRPEDLARYQELQLELLQAASTLLLPGGTLIYATCSLEEEENEQVIERFLETNENFLLEECTAFLPSGAHTLCRKNFFAPLPGDEIDGFFGARLRRLSEAVA